MPITLLALALLAGCRRQEKTTNPPSVGLHEAVVEGNLAAIRQHIAAGSDLNERNPSGGGSPLISAAAFGRTEAAKALIQAGVDLNYKNNDGATALITAAFLCHTEIVELLLEHGADQNARNNAGATALESAAGPFDEVKGIYEYLQSVFGPVGLKLDYERIKVIRPKIADILHKNGSRKSAELKPI